MNHNGKKVRSAPLDSVVKISGGGTPSKRIPEYYTGDIPWVTPKDMKSWFIDDAVDHITRDAIAASSTSLVEPDAVLVCIRSGVLAHTLPVAINRVPVTLNQDMKAFRCSDQLYPAYLARFLKWYSPQLLSTVRGTTAHNLSMDVVKRVEIPLPPLSEQKRIADILDKADAIRRKRQQAVVVDELIKTIFFDLFGNPLLEHPTFNAVPFGDLTDRITYGFTCPMDHIEAGIPIITGKNIRDGFIDFDNVHFARRDQFDSLTAKSKPNRGDILIIKDGAIRGRCAILESSSPICINQSVAVVQPNRSRVTSEFLYGYLSCHEVRRKINAMDKGVAMPHLQITELAKFPAIIPPLEAQEHFTQRYRNAVKLGNRISRSVSEMDGLFNSLVQRAFKGEL
ncbi:MAG TPA: hypothetical protein DDW52_10850 [Planctomycetaceae bacterium]|nr:hypothetical protein [Planctomycetaceae bacterium]